MACEDVGIEPVVCRGFAGKQDGGNLGPADTVIGTAGDLQGLQQQGQKQSQSKLAVRGTCCLSGSMRIQVVGCPFSCIFTYS